MGGGKVKGARGEGVRPGEREEALRQDRWCVAILRTEWVLNQSQMRPRWLIRCA
jgi:hypothetical protein